MIDTDNSKLIETALEAMKNSYAPYSGFNVGAALECGSGKVYTGCNVENAAFSPSICAERTAIAKAVSEGEREFLKIAVVGGKNGAAEKLCPPCGVCRQVLAEFCPPDFEVILSDGSDIKCIRLNELIPFSFGKANLSSTDA